MLFDPVNTRFQFLRQDPDSGDSLLSYFLSNDLSESSIRPRATVTKTSDVINYILIGLWNEVRVQLPEITLWTTTAIDNDEAAQLPSADWRRADLYEARALQRYLLSNDRAVDDWDCARDWWLQTLCRPSFQEANPKSYFKTDGLDQYIALCIHSKRFDEGVRMYHEQCGDFKKRLSQIRTPRDFGYALCKSVLNSEPFTPELSAAGDRMLSRYLEDLWLGYGQNIRSASWLKVYYDYAAPDLPGFECIKRAYDHMPNVPRPEFV